jgi:hypothetical protein
MTCNDIELQVRLPIRVDKLMDKIRYVLVTNTMKVECGFHCFS